MDDTSGFFTATAGPGTGPDCSSFELLHSSGEGYSVLYLGNSGGRRRVYKALKEQYRSDTLYEDLLRKEYEIGCQLDHPNICQYLGYGRIEGLGNAIEMEWVNGTTLDKIGNLSRKQVLNLLEQLCSAIDYMHSRQIIHRDIKPSNILVAHNGKTVKLIDFGFSDSDSHTILKAPAGTLEYASPEQIAGLPLDSRSDIYSLGKIISLILPQQRSVISKCLSKDRENRPQTAAEVLILIRRSWKRRRLSVWISGIVVATLTAAGAIWGWKDDMETVEEPSQSVNEGAPLSLDDVLNQATQLIIDADGQD